MRYSFSLRWGQAVHRSSWFIAPVLVFLVCLSIYLATLTQVHTFDALSYVLDVDRKPWQELFHPHHLAYGPLGVLVRKLAWSLGFTGSAVVPLQIANALAGALGVALFFALIRALMRRSDLALCGALLLAASYAYWYYAIEVEVYTFAILFLVLCLWLMIHLLKRPTWPLWAVLGLMQGMAILFHQTNVLLCMPVLVVLLLARVGTQKTKHIAESRASDRIVSARRIGYGLWYGVPLVLVVGGSYLFVGFGISGFRSGEQWLDWMLKYARTGWWGRPVTQAKWQDLGQGLADTLAQPGGSLLGLLLVGLLVVYARHLARRDRPLNACLVAWLLSYGAFFFWWEPDNVEFWIASLPPALLLLILALGSGGPRWHAGVWVALSIGLMAFGLNYDSIVRRGFAAYDVQRLIASGLAHQSKPGDLLLVPDGLQELYLPYYEERVNVLSLNQAMFDNGASWASACAGVQARISVTLASGNAVLVGDEVLRPVVATPQDTPAAGGRGRGRVLERFGLTQSQVMDCFNRYLPDLTPINIGAGLPAYYRLPSAQELADGPGWDFARSSWGWRSTNVDAERFDMGWMLVPGVDPSLISPLMQIDTSRYQAIEVRMAAATASRDAQIFFIDRNGQTDEARSMRWSLLPGTAVQTYRLEVRGQPGWSGIVTGLRLDPVGVGDGGWVRIESIRLVQ